MAKQSQKREPAVLMQLKKLFSLLLLLTLLAPSLFHFKTPVHAASGNSSMTVHFLDVGQGLSIFVQSNGQNLIYDGGDTSASDYVISYLQQQGVSTIDYLISSHYDSDHLAGLIECLNTFNVNNVISSDYIHDSQLYDSFVKETENHGLQMQHPKVGTVYPFGSGNFQILAPAFTDSSDSNDNSIAIKLNNGTNSFIFTGDAESTSEYEMCASGIDLSCDVLVPGHHGSATATSWDLLQASVPAYAVISCGTDNSYGHPDKDTMDKLEAMEIPVYRTDKQGTIIAVSDGTSLSWNMEPCSDYSSGDENDLGTQPEESSHISDTQENILSQDMVWLSATGSKFHSINNCGRMNPNKAYQVSRADAAAMGYDACSKCY